MATASFSQLSAVETATALRNNPHAQLIDVREPGEYETEHVPGSINVPLSSFGKSSTRIDRTAPAYILCQVGGRAAFAANQLAGSGHGKVIVVSGGINAWKGAELPTVQGERRVWVMERQVRFTAGLLILAGIALSLTLHPWFLAISAFIGAGLAFSGITGWCGMALVLGRCPWNRHSK